MFMTYLHQNYPPFCDDIENCHNMMSYMSMSDSLLRLEGDNVSPDFITFSSYLRFLVSVLTPRFDFALLVPSMRKRRPLIITKPCAKKRSEDVQV